MASEQVRRQSERDLLRAELIAFPLLLLLGIWIFRGLVAALLPVAAGVLSIVTTLAMLRLANSAVTISVFALNLVTGAGLGLAIDYSLLLLSRYREELAHSEPEAALRDDGRDGGEDGRVQRGDGRGGVRVAARLPARVPALDGDRRDRRRAARRGRRAARRSPRSSRCSGGASTRWRSGTRACVGRPAAGTGSRTV